ncbi:response regulator [Methylobacterium sp. J-026]|nr:response regulator [Methylobacterium sp. J-026]
MEAVAILDSLGFEVLEADCAHIALGHLNCGKKIHLLYTDIRMPGGMSGVDLAHAVASRWPETAIIVCSGCMPEAAEDLPEDAHFISKPCAEKLVRKALTALQLH